MTIKCVVCDLTRERYHHRHEASPEHAAKIFLRETCKDKSSCVFQVTNDEPGSDELLQAQLQRSGLISKPLSPQSPQIMELMTFTDYQITSSATAVYPAVNPIIYCALGLFGETGEVAEKIKKVLRDNNGEFDADTVAAIKLELGDVLWYLAQLATELGLSLDAIAKANIQKTQDRQKRGQLGGSGDNR